ncbi:MAG: GerMN domain-containing protein [Bacilli bacterium]|nr:GerMN domain-containing protein [Bacilli bacterium]
MLKNITMKRIAIATILLFICFLFVLFPKNEDKISLKGESVEYTNTNSTHEIFMVNKDNYVARTNVLVNENDIEKKVREILEYLIIDGKKESGVPNGFRSIIPSGTEIKSIKLVDGLLKINFSKEILEISKELEEKMLESIVYSLTSINGVKGILIYVEDELLTVLPKTKTNLPSILTRDIGINKEYDITDTKNITKTTIYYVSKNNDSYYYVPVTKVNNSNKDKVKVIVDELSSGPIYEDNLMSFMNLNTKLENYELKDDKMYLTFNEYILDNLEEKNILEEVIYSIGLSVMDNYKVKDVVFLINGEEIVKSVVKTLE